MKKSRNIKFNQRIIAALLAVLMVLSLLPVPSVMVVAETEPGLEEETGTEEDTGLEEGTETEGVKIAVVDENNNPIVKGSVECLIYYYEDNIQKYLDSPVTGNTDAEGMLEVLSLEEYNENGEKELFISGSVSKDGYKYPVEEGINIKSGEENKIKVNINDYPEVVIKVNESTYDGSSKDLVNITLGDSSDNCTIFYNTKDISKDEDWKLYSDENIPQIENFGTYPIYVRVEKEGYTFFESGKLEATIEKAKINDICIEPNKITYDGERHNIFANVSGIREEDKVIYTYNNQDFNYTRDSGFPEIENAGEYNIKVKVHRNSNYVDFEKDYIAEIYQAKIENINVNFNNNLTYTGEPQELVESIEGLESDDKVEYSLNEGEVGESWSSEIPTGTDAGEYNISIRVYRDENHDIKMIESNPYRLVIKRATQVVEFNKKLPEQLTSDDIDKEFDFSLKEGSFKASDITYKVENYAQDDTTDISEIAEITDNGKLTVKSAGYIIKVTATVDENENYNEASVEHVLNIVYKTNGEENELLSFNDEELIYVFGENNTISNQVAKKDREDDNGKISYSASIEDSNIPLDNSGISINKDSGEIIIIDYSKLSEILKINNGELKLIVTANKEAGKKRGWFGFVRETFSSYKKSYSITITTEPLPAGNAFTMKNPDGDSIDGPNGNGDWYNTAVTVIPAEGYEISTGPDPSSFENSVVFADQGTSDRIVYLRNTDTGGITAAILTDIENLDSKAPDVNNITIEYSESKNSLERFIEDILYDFKFYNPDVTITFTAYDDTSGVDTFNWQYTRSEGASEINTADDEGIIDAVQDKFEDKKYTATLTLPRNEAEQLRGRLSVSATDKAGNKSKIKSDERNIIVVDSISPTQTVSYELKDDENYNEVETTDGITHYFSGDVEFTFAINEANFYEDQVDFIVKKDGDDYYTPELQNLTWDKLSEDQSEEDQHEDLYVANLVLSEEGTYEISMHCTDYSGNEMEPYNSETIIIDKTAPKIEFSYADHTDNENPQSATITIEEKNFCKEDIELVTVAKDITGNEVKANDLEEYLRTCEWTKDGDIHTATISSQFVDAIYDLTINYKDLACNEADEVKPPTFIIDHVAPATSNMSVTYSTPLMKKILSKITFGYYNPSVNVTFTAHDDISGVDYFNWTYNRENGVSTSNKATYAEEKLIAVQDSKDKTKFTASITLPKNKAEQLRGNVTFKATDKSNNVSEKITDTNNVIVVDTIAPTMTVEYSDPSNTVGRKMYYNKAMTATFAVTEANFYSEDVIVELSKDGVSPIRIKPSWVDVSTDLHIGTYTIPAPSDHSKDGDYVISVKYKDRSNNQMKTYTSNTLVIDTTNPVISVLYADNSPINTMVDSEGNQRKYFSNTQTATVSIKERNFNANDMKYSIVAKDVEGNILNNNSLYRMSSWESKGDVHTMTITYPGDANYTFDLAYTDLAANEAADYRPDYFTVDTTKPTNHTVSYSTSLLDTILSNITFGFYDAKVRVTLSATDNTSKVNSFKYSYVNAAGVSSSNSELIDQIIEESGIRYSNGGRTATTTFDIPKGLLGSNNQFNGTVNFDATDRSGNISDQSQETKRIVVDNISPTANVEYNTPVQTIGGVSYYDGDITPRVTINEANFYPEDVIISVTRDGQAYPVSPSWTDNSADVHVGSFTLSGDGDYLISVSYTDKSNNFMEEYTSEQLTIDTEINEPVLTINGEEADGKAFKDDILLEFSFEDINFESYEITLLRTNYGNKNVNVTDEFIDDHVKVSETGVSARVDSFDKIAENDGIYNIKVSFTDKAGHYAEKSAKFTVNRYGSVYEYNDYLISLIADGGAYTQKVDEDLVITEYNADRLLSQSLNIEVLRDGKPIDNPAIEVSPEIDNQVSAGNSGWYQYQYTINKSNFSGDGVYKIIVSSEDATGNNPENTNYDDKSIVFHVDSTPPEINSITGLDNNIINQANVDVNYTVYDAIGLASVEVYVDGKEINKITDFSSDLNNYSGSFTLSESSSEQKVRLLVTDLAGNVTDTSKEDFTSAYVFNDSVLISTNTFVRWTANKPVFWGSIAGAAGTVAIGTAGTVFFRRKKRIKK